MDGGEEGSCVFGIAGGDAAPTLEMEECIFNQMAQAVEIFVVFSLHFAIPFRWDDRLHALFFRLFQDDIGIVTAVGQQVFGGEPFDQAARLSTICCCTFCNNNPDRHTMRVHGQMQFCVEPPFVRLMS